MTPKSNKGWFAKVRPLELPRFFLIGLLGLFYPALLAKSSSPAFKMGDKTFAVDELGQGTQSEFFKLERQKYDLIETIAKEKYLEKFWEEQKESLQATSLEEARKRYFEKNALIGENEIKQGLLKFKSHPHFKDLHDEAKRRELLEYLRALKARELLDGIIDEAIKSKKLVLLYPMPTEPIYATELSAADPIRYGPLLTDTKPDRCSTDCPLTVVEYSEFQCAFCAKGPEVSKRLLTAYKGRIRWVVRDFPLGFHTRAKAAAIAARCAKDQGKYWELYELLFKNQRALSDEDLAGYAKSIALDQGRFTECLKSPGPLSQQVDDNFLSGKNLGVVGTPTFFINGRKFSEALSFEEFQKIFEEELSKIKK